MSRVEQTTQPPSARKRGPGAVPEAVWAPLAGGVLTLLPGLLGLAAGYPWLFPSLAPTALLQAAQPQEPSSRLYNVVVGHLTSLAAGVLAVLLLGADAKPSTLATGQLYPPRVWASGLAVTLTVAAQVPLRALQRCSPPPPRPPCCSPWATSGRRGRTP
jgi:hypothetical protein